MVTPKHYAALHKLLPVLNSYLSSNVGERLEINMFIFDLLAPLCGGIGFTSIVLMSTALIYKATSDYGLTYEKGTHPDDHI